MILFILIKSILIKGQDVKCDELVTYVERNGRYYQEVNEVQLMNSTWLKKVTAYSIDNKIVVVAEIKRDQWGINTKKYIFCGITSDMWTAFYMGINDLDKTYGERFQKYIFDNKCNCIQ